MKHRIEKTWDGYMVQQMGFINGREAWWNCKEFETFKEAEEAVFLWAGFEAVEYINGVRDET